MRKQHTTTDFVCDWCGKQETHESTSSFTPPGWFRRPKLYMDDAYKGTVGGDYCSVACTAAAIKRFLEDHYGSDE